MVQQEIRHILFPPRCPGCDQLVEEEGFCAKCKKEITVVTEPVCKRCGKQLEESWKEYCYDCHRKHHFYTQGKGVYLYEGPMKLAMYRLKYSNRRCYSRVFTAELMEQYQTWIKQKGIQAIIPIPMYKSKERRRGYNQAKVLARELGRQTQIPVEEHLVMRVKNTVAQKNLSDMKRKQNLKNAFKITGNRVQLERVLLIDDIYTTGSTMDAVSQALLQAGVQEIYFICICIGKGF